MKAVETLGKALQDSRSISIVAFEKAARSTRQTGFMSDVLAPNITGMLTDWKQEERYRSRYGLFSGWLYSAVNAICHRGASQKVLVGRKKKTGKPKSYSSTKSTMTSFMSSKASGDEVDIIEDHPIKIALEKPNPIQGRWQFTYSFLSNLCLTGWAYVVKDFNDEGEMEFYSLPTNWIKADHTQGPFSRFKVVDPGKPDSQQDGKWLDRTQVGFAHLPNPADPRMGFAPADARAVTIRIDDHIQTSREVFFHQGVFPSVIVTVGKDPHPDVPGGIRQRLSPSQRRQVHMAIKQAMGSIANYGSPAIIDGLIENVERLSMTNTEMGWEKSEESVKKAILSVFCVHPFILGETVSVGGYAQAAIIKGQFYDRVNSYLDMLSNLMTNLANEEEDEKDLLVWWERLEVKDVQQWNQMVQFARRNNDISQNELRTLLGYGPDEDRNESVIEKGMIGSIVSLLEKVGGGKIQNDQAMALLEGLGIPSDLAKTIAGPKVEKSEEATEPVDGKPPVEEESEEEELKKAVAELRRMDYVSGKVIAEMVVDIVKDWTQQPRIPAGRPTGGEWGGMGWNFVVSPSGRGGHWKKPPKPKPGKKPLKPKPPVGPGPAGGVPKRGKEVLEDMQGLIKEISARKSKDLEGLEKINNELSSLASELENTKRDYKNPKARERAFGKWKELSRTQWVGSPEVRKAKGELDKLSELTPESKRKVQTLKGKWDQLMRGRTRIAAKMHKREKEGREAAKKLLALPKNQQARLTASYRGKNKKAVEEGLKDFESLVSNKALGDARSVKIKDLKSSRSCYEDGKGVSLGAGSGKSSMVHELGHHLEYARSINGINARRFLAEQTRGKRVVSLGLRYRNSEKYFPKAKGKGTWINNYMGKYYRHGATEILSMGLEYMVKDPVMFAKKDPAAFAFVLDVARGHDPYGG